MTLHSVTGWRDTNETLSGYSSMQQGKEKLFKSQQTLKNHSDSFSSVPGTHHQQQQKKRILRKVKNQFQFC